jgi:hypothetical protein
MENWQSVPGYKGLYRNTAPPPKTPLNTAWLKRFGLRATVGFGSFLAVTTMIHALNAPRPAHTWRDDPIVAAAPNPFDRFDTQPASEINPDIFGFEMMRHRIPCHTAFQCGSHHRHSRGR